MLHCELSSSTIAVQTTPMFVVVCFNLYHYFSYLVFITMRCLLVLVVVCAVAYAQGPGGHGPGGEHGDPACTPEMLLFSICCDCHI